MHILMFCNFELPDSCANASRVFSFAQLLRNNGHRVSILGVSYCQKQPISGLYDDFRYNMLQALPYRGVLAYKRIADLQKQLAKQLEVIHSEETIDAIFLSNVYYDFSNSFYRFSKKNHVPLIINAVEWYATNSELFKGLTGKVNFVKNRIALMHIHKKMKNILAISSLLDNYYKERGCNTITVPTIVDTDKYASVARTKCSNRSALHIAYAGNPGKKDYVLNAIRALPLLTEEEIKRIQFHFYGVSYQQLHKLGLSKEFIEMYTKNLVCHGRIPYERVKANIADADFTVLLRPNLRYANAGFPTKVGESMACGTPVIANLTSDLGKYIIDGQTGFVCADESSESCAAAFRKALQMSVEEIETMRKNTLKMARKAFDYRVYADALETFFQQLQ